MHGCSRYSEYMECPVIDYPRDRELFIKKFLEIDPNVRANQLSGFEKRKKLLKAKTEKDASEIYDVLIDYEQKRFLDFKK